MSKILAATAAIIGLSLGSALATNYHDYHAWSQPTVHDEASYRDHPAWSHLTVPANYNPGRASSMSVHRTLHRKH